jgi:hypothetical protein
MNDDLAERLLAEVLAWTPDDVASERPLIQAMASYKYDEYQRYSPGMRFVESLALWLGQFDTVEQRQWAYEFVKTRLLFCSTAEINHLVTAAYPDEIRPFLVGRAASVLGMPAYKVRKVVCSREFQVLQRRSLFLGLSDGARLDVFRRTNRELSHEQIYTTYEPSEDREQDLLKSLKEDLKSLLASDYQDEDACFSCVFLMDDFSGSGRSYVRPPKVQGNGYGGKIVRALQLLVDSQSQSVDSEALVSQRNLYVGIVLYVCTDQAEEYIMSNLKNFLNTLHAQGREVPEVGIHIVQRLSSNARLDRPSDDHILDLADQYYDCALEDEHTRVGGDTVKFGFAGCSLGLSLVHNTPNNSLPLLWADPDEFTIRGLFPRASRHRSRQ